MQYATPDARIDIVCCVCRLIQLVVTIIYNLFVLRPAEVMIGWIRTVLIFFGSGIAGSLASAIFLPYLVTVSRSLALGVYDFGPGRNGSGDRFVKRRNSDTAERGAEGICVGPDGST